MTSRLRSVRSQDMINASQNAVSSPRDEPATQREIQVEATVEEEEFVEDSMKERMPSQIGGLVRLSGTVDQEEEDEEEDSHSVTTAGKAHTARKKDIAARDMTAEPDVDATNRLSAYYRSTNAGASKMPPKQADMKSAATQKVASAKRPRNLLHDDDDIGANEKRVTQIRHGKQQQTPSISGDSAETARGLQPLKLSAVEAMKAKRLPQADDKGTDTRGAQSNFRAAPSGLPSAGKLRPPTAKQRAGDLRASNAGDGLVQNAGKKQQPRSNPQPSRAMAGPVPASANAASHKPSNHRASQGSNTEVNSKKRHRESPARAITPEKKSAKPKAVMKDAFDAPESSEEEEDDKEPGSEYRPNKKAKTSKAGTAGARQRGRPAKPTKAATKAPPSNQRSSSRATRAAKRQNKRKAQDEDGDPPAVNTAKNRMKALDTGSQSGAAAPRQKKKASIAPNVADETDKENEDGAGEAEYPMDEPAEESEAHNVQYQTTSGHLQHRPHITTTARHAASLQVRGNVDQTSCQAELGDKTAKPLDASHGKSQENAITLSDSRSSSSISQSPETRTDERTHLKRVDGDGHGPKTPIVPPSSPPLPNYPTAPPLVDTDTLKKVNMIHFGKQGPLNQGTISARKLAASAAQALSRLPSPTIVHPDHEIESRARPQERIDNETSHAMMNGKSENVKKPTTAASVPAHAPRELAKVRNDGRLPKEPIVSNFQPSRTSRTSIFEEDSLPTVDDDVPFHFIDPEETMVGADEFEEPGVDREIACSLPGREETGSTSTTNVIQQRTVKRTISQEVMPPPPLPSKKPILLAVARAAKVVIYSPAGRAPPIFKPPRATGTGNLFDSVSDFISKRAADDVPRDEPAPKRHHTVKEDQDLPLGHTRRMVRKPARNPSSGSQRVDKEGSPIPDGMVVAEDATVLETFSQQRDHRLDVKSARNDAKIGNKAIQTDESWNVTRLAPPQVQPRQLSSNTKQKPGAPEAQSRAITAHGKTHNGRLLAEDITSVPGTDPFTSSDEPRDGNASTRSSSFMEELRRVIADKQEGGVDNQAEEEDPDRTLVEPVQAPISLKHTAHAMSISDVSSVDDSQRSDESVTEEALNLGVWRNGLLPHQSNLFDELINVSHRLVSHLVDTETAVTHAVEDFRRRALGVVEKMEASHTSRYRKTMSTLQERQKRLCKDLGEYDRKVCGIYKAVDAANRQRCGVAKTSTMDGWRDLLAEHC